MNWTRFGLRRPPFAPGPDVRAYVPLATHEAAVCAVERAFAGGNGLALVDGGQGLGKSLTALRFASQLPAEQPCVVVPAARFGKPADLLQAILFDLGAEYRGLSETELRLAVTDRLLSAGSRTVIVLDEAHHLSDDALEEVRLLGNVPGRDGPAAFVLLVASPTLREQLDLPGLAAVASRLVARCRLEPLDADESAKFLRAQVDDAALDDEAVGVLSAHGRGSPRLLNQAAALAFALAAENDASAVDAEAALEAVSQLGLVEAEPALLPLPAKSPTPRRPKKRKSA